MCRTGRVKFFCNAYIPSLTEMELKTVVKKLDLTKLIFVLKIFFQPNNDFKGNCRVARERLLICSLPVASGGQGIDRGKRLLCCPREPEGAKALVGMAGSV